MAQGAVDVTLDAAPDAVWAKVGDFGGVGEFFPGIESFRLEGDDRVIGMFGMEIRERLVSRDDATRTLSYSVVEACRSRATPPPSPSSPRAMAPR